MEVGASPTGGASAGATCGSHGRLGRRARPESRPCQTCRARLRVALEYAVACHTPIRDRTVGRHEALAWAWLRAASSSEVREALAAIETCDGI